MSVLKLIYKIPDPKNFDFYALETNSIIKAVLYTCGCVYISKKLRQAVLFPQRCGAHDDRWIVGFWTHLSLTKRNLKVKKYILHGDKE